MGGADFRTQARALFRKNVVFQRRNAKSNCCLLSAPIAFCVLLFVIQMVVNRLLLGREDFKCGCLCTECCETVNGVDVCGANPPGLGYCPFTCKKRDDTKCGIQYSSPVQSAFCPVPTPSSWPAAVSIPDQRYMAAPSTNQTVLMFSGSDQATASSMAAGLIKTPNITAATLQQAQAYVQALGSPVAANGTIYAEVLSLLGLQFATAKPLSSLYLDVAFLGADAVSVLVPAAYCAANNATSNSTLVQFLGKVAGPQLQAILAGAGGAGGAGGAASAAAGSLLSTLGALNAVKVQCVDAPTSYLATTAAIEQKLYCGYFQARCNGVSETNQYTAAFDFNGATASNMSVGIYYNDTLAVGGGRGGGAAGGGQPARYQRMAGIVSMGINSWVEKFLGPQYAVQLRGLQATPKPEFQLKLDFSSLLGPLFYMWVVQMLLPIFLLQLVYEKEKRLRMMMKMHGLGDGAYWLITYTWDLLLYIAYMFIFIGFGSAIGLEIFRRNDYGVQIIFYFLFGNNMIAFAFLLSCLFTSNRTAVVFAFLWVFGTGLIGDLLLANFINADAWYMVLIELIPAFSLYRGLYELGQYSFLGVYKGSKGLTFSKFSDKGCGMSAVLIILTLEWFLFMGLAYYLEQVLSSGTGIRKHPLFFLDRWRKVQPEAKEANHEAIMVGGDSEREDVAAERERIMSMADTSAIPIVVKDMRKVFPAIDSAPPKVAVRTLTLGIERGECFGLLGPNGAGKSTSINMMTGFMEPSGGTAVICGKDIRTAMNEIYTIMGVCPQHDLLWETLTGRQHLEFYGLLKGLHGPELAKAVETGLKAVNLWNSGVADKQSQQYSGGMKRRLSVAISFIGSPDVVYLDEPSTGLDPASRRNLWDVVKASKRDKSIILTTHSMEEAEMLCDRLGIFVDGQLVCIGNPKEITTRYGGYYVFTVTVPPGSEAQAERVVLSMAPGARLTYSLGGTMKYELPTKEVTLSKVFSTMAQHKAGLRVMDWGVANATLEEVFIKFARQIGAKTNEMR